MHREKGTPSLQQDHSEETSPATQHTLGSNEASGALLPSAQSWVLYAFAHKITPK